jgi:putative nucleotidyltransferase with HDIG domain
LALPFLPGKRGLHRFDVLDHSLLACDCAAGEGYGQEVRMAALLHDIGKPLTARRGEGVWTFYRHEEESAHLAEGVLRRFRYPNAFTAAVTHLVREHMFHYEANWTDAAVRRFLIRVGEESLSALWQLRRADAFAASGAPPPPDFLLPLQERVEKARESGRALSLKDLAVSGTDLLAAGFVPGRRLGAALRELLDAVVEDPALNTRDKLLEIAGKLGG